MSEEDARSMKESMVLLAELAKMLGMPEMPALPFLTDPRGCTIQSAMQDIQRAIVYLTRLIATAHISDIAEYVAKRRDGGGEG